MPEIKLTNITKRWGKFYAVDNLNLHIENNSFITILGPSGCGKTTTLRMIAGLETPTSGQIKIGDQIVYDSDQGINIPPNKRKVGFLFQNYALWPNMTVYDNISFGLKNIKEELPVMDIELKTTSDVIRSLQNTNKLTQIFEECKEKTGKIDKKRLLLKLINTYTISKYTAEKIFKFNLHSSNAIEQDAKKYIQQFEEKKNKLIAAHQSKNETVNEKFEVVENHSVKKIIRKLSNEEIDLSVNRVARIVKIGMFMDRYPAELSGGQQQRVAIARTLAPEPQVLFMDEPLSNLDAKLRLEMRYELQRLHVETGSTFVYVTHDQMEAMTLSTKICLMNNGLLQQYDYPLSLYNKPNNLFCADFVGNPSINFLEAKGKQNQDGTFTFTVLDNKTAVFKPEHNFNMQEWFEHRDAEKHSNDLDEKSSNKVEKENKDEVFKYHIQKVNEDYISDDDVIITNEDFILGIRPEKITVDVNGKLDAAVDGSMPTGMESTLKLNINNYLLTSVIFGNQSFVIGDQVHITVLPYDILLYDRKSGKLIASGSVTIQ